MSSYGLYLHDTRTGDAVSYFHSDTRYAYLILGFVEGSVEKLILLEEVISNLRENTAREESTEKKERKEVVIVYLVVDEAEEEEEEEENQRGRRRMEVVCEELRIP